MTGSRSINFHDTPWKSPVSTNPQSACARLIYQIDNTPVIACDAALLSLRFSRGHGYYLNL